MSDRRCEMGLALITAAALILGVLVSGCCKTCKPRVITAPPPPCLTQPPPIRPTIERSNCIWPWLTTCLGPADAWTLAEYLAEARIWMDKSWLLGGPKKETTNEAHPDDDPPGPGPDDGPGPR